MVESITRLAKLLQDGAEATCLPIGADLTLTLVRPAGEAGDDGYELGGVDWFG